MKLCHTYDVQRCYLLNCVNAILLSHGLANPSNNELVDIILYGHKHLSFASNASILNATLECIKAIKNALNKCP